MQKNMKKTFLFLAMAAALVASASCTKELETVEPEVPAADSELVFTANIGVGTKVEFGEAGALKWKSGDRIKVYAMSATGIIGSESIAASNISADGKKAYFVSQNLAAAASSSIAFVAYIEGTGLGEPVVKDDIMGFPTASNFGIGDLRTMSCATCAPDEPVLNFKNFACIMKVTTNRTDVGVIALQGRNGEKADHVGIIGIDQQFHDTTGTDAQGNVATAVNGPGTYYLCLAPGIEFTKGFKILLYDKSWNELVQFSYLDPFTTKSNTLYNFGTLDSTDQANGQLFRKQIKDAGYNPDDYYRIKFNVTMYSFFNSTGNTGDILSSVANSGAADDTPKKFCATQVFSKDELPNGTLLVVRPDHMYRPEGWQTLGQKNTATRPGNVYTPVVEVNDAWWGNYTYRGFNIGRADAGEYKFSNSDLYLGYNMMSKLQENFAIYIPKDKLPATSVQGMLVAAGKNLEDYDQMYVNVIQKAFWNSSTNSNLSCVQYDAIAKVNYFESMIPQARSKDTSTAKKFHATRIFTKDELPNGTVIVVKPGYQYRPDAWVSLSSKNSNRPGNVTTSIVTVDDAWWGSFNYRGFNLLEVTTSGSGAFSYAGNELTRASFAIFVPKAK